MNTTLNPPTTSRFSMVCPSARNRNRRARPALTNVAVLALAASVVFVRPVQAQESLRDTLRDRGVDWIVGPWTGTNSQGLLVAIEYEWELEGHLLEIDLTMGDGAYKGAILRRPADGELVEVGADAGGGMTHATWEVQDGALISKRTGTRPGGQVTRIAVRSEKVDADTVVATVHPLSPEGELGEETLDTVRLMRAPDEPDED